PVFAARITSTLFSTARNTAVVNICLGADVGPKHASFESCTIDDAPSARIRRARSGVVVSKKINVPSFAPATSLSVKLLPGVISPTRAFTSLRNGNQLLAGMYSTNGTSAFLSYSSIFSPSGHMSIVLLYNDWLRSSGCGKPQLLISRKIRFRWVNSASLLRSAESRSYSKFIVDSGQITSSIVGGFFGEAAGGTL